MISCCPRKLIFCAAAGILTALPVKSFAAEGAAPKPIILESGLAYVEKKKKDGILSSVEQKVGQVPSVGEDIYEFILFNLELIRAIW